MRKPHTRVSKQRTKPLISQNDILAAQSQSCAFILIDHAQRICFVSAYAEQLLHVKAAQLIHKPWFQILTMVDAEAQNPVQRMLNCRTLKTHQSFYKNTDPQRFFSAELKLIETSAQRLCVNMNFVEAAKPALKQDETSPLNDERELNHLLRLNTVGELATSIAHELNQPLSAILSYSQAATRLLHEDEPDWGLAANATLNAAEQARRAGDILQQLRNFVGKGHSKPELLSINRCIRNSVTLLAESLETAQIQLVLRTQPCPLVLIDAIHLEQVLVNLLQNAIDALKPVAGLKQITVTTCLEHEQVKVRIQDNGPGIAPDDQEHIFDRFFSTKPNGMGLGLNICRRIITSAGGELEAISPHEGGALFQISLPAILNAKELQNAEPIT